MALFEDVTESSGLGDYEGMTHGAAWGDHDGDGQLDLVQLTGARQDVA